MVHRLFSFLFLLSVLLLAIQPVHAADITLNLRVDSVDDRVSIHLSNAGSSTADGLTVELLFDGQTYSPPFATSLQAGSAYSAEQRIRLPTKPGSYPIHTRVTYLNDGTRVGLDTVGLFRFQIHESERSPTHIETTVLRRRAKAFISHAPSERLTVVSPAHIGVVQRRYLPNGSEWYFENRAPAIQSNSEIYAILEIDSSNGHSTRIVTGRVQTRRDSRAGNIFQLPHYAIATLVFLGATVFFHRRWNERLSARRVAIVRWSFSVAVVSYLLSLYSALPILSEFLIADMGLDRALQGFARSSEPGGFGFYFGRYVANGVQRLVEWISFSGGDYDYFNQYVLDLLFLYIVFLNGFVLYFFIQPVPERDKYWHLMTRVCRAFLPARQRIAADPKLVRVALLTLAVKAFYVPLLCSWSINNVFHQRNLIDRFTWDFAFINEFLVATFIFVDVAYFAIGYLTELPQLRNVIRSVEPTLLGWAVCLICYPPFNSFAYAPFDIPLHDVWEPWRGSSAMFVTFLVTVLWFTYTWATVALGVKSSNLTNRGIVSRGPYAFIRHPAYASKVGLWALSAYAFGDRNFFLIVTFVTIYALRAWTEERHLSSDPEYVEYKKKVKWAVVPGIL